MVTMTVCATILLSGAVILVTEIINPETDTSDGLRTITGILNTLIGLIAGFLAGKTGSTLSDKPEKDPPS
jgi:hypothetical protein